ncbi:MAG: FG-GAP-like repeat-containing protein [Candidatus Krumholzibacteria bacterium]|nr:FG-GAP-like repeat-containing protein [Candidatus Krumholzibacteria bacterium]
MVSGDEYNLSKGYLQLSVPPGEEAAGICFDLGENNLQTIPITMSTMVAWSWYVNEHREDTNGLWMVLRFRDLRTGQRDVVRTVSLCNSSFEVCSVYFDPDRTWIYHKESVSSCIHDRFKPFSAGDLVIESIGFGASRAPGMLARIDNVWIGEGYPPPEINTIDIKEQNSTGGDPRLEGFSFGHIDGDEFPDRVEIFGNRLEIVPGSSCRLNGASGNSATNGRAGGVEKVILDLKRWGSERVPVSASIVDLDGDGQDDMLVHFDDKGGNRFYRNDMRRGKLEDLSGLDGVLEYKGEKFYGTAEADMDGDGDIDLFMINHIDNRGRSGGVRFVRNEGRSGWADWTDSSGVLMKNAFGGTFSDFDFDGDQDLFVPYRAYDLNEWPGGRPYLNMNDGSGRFTFDPARISLGDSIHIEGAAAADFDNDGDMDIYVVVRQEGLTGKSQVPGSNVMLLNDGSGFFAESPGSEGFGEPRMSQSALAADFDQDGDVDIYEINDRNHCFFFRNNGGVFAAGDSLHADFIYRGRAAGGLAVDYDSDGDIDIIINDKDKMEPQILSNGSARGGFLQVRLRGIEGNRAGIGAKVCVYEAGSLEQPGKLVGFREIHSGQGFGMHGPPVAHFGLGSRSHVDLLVVFPAVNGKEPVRVVKRDVPANSFLYIPGTNNAAARLWHSWKAARARYLLSSLIFSVPGWLASLILFGVLWFTGINVRKRFDGAIPRGGDMRGSLMPVYSIAAPASAALLILAAALFRSWAWSAPAVLAAAVMVGGNHEIVATTARILGFKRDREMEETHLVKMLSRILHPEGEFSFLEEFKTVDAPIIRKYKNGIGPSLKAIESCIEMLCRVAGEGRNASEAEEAFSDIKETIAELLSPPGEGEDGSLKEIGARFKKQKDRLDKVLGESRENLRSRYFIDFKSEWEKLAGRRDRELDEAGIEFSCDFTGADNVKLYLSSGEFQDIFSNLLTNSIWAVSDLDDKRIRIEARTDRRHLRLRWLDSGCGIAAEYRESLFKNEVSSGRPGGKGEGCAITGRILNDKQGEAYVDDAPQGWSTLIVIRIVRTG